MLLHASDDVPSSLSATLFEKVLDSHRTLGGIECGYGYGHALPWSCCAHFEGEWNGLRTKVAVFWATCPFREQEARSPASVTMVENGPRRQLLDPRDVEQYVGGIHVTYRIIAGLVVVGIVLGVVIGLVLKKRFRDETLRRSILPEAGECANDRLDRVTASLARESIDGPGQLPPCGASPWVPTLVAGAFPLVIVIFHGPLFEFLYGSDYDGIRNPGIQAYLSITGLVYALLISQMMAR